MADVGRVACCSAPGKVLITGGYMILDQPNSGLVITVDSRFYTKIEQLNEIHSLNLSGHQTQGLGSDYFFIEIYSPQFEHTEEYIFSWDERQLIGM
jgi:phosphomevalonate kinase